MSELGVKEGGVSQAMNHIMGGSLSSLIKQAPPPTMATPQEEIGSGGGGVGMMMSMGDESLNFTLAHIPPPPPPSQVQTQLQPQMQEPLQGQEQEIPSG